jgi:hypothetical protein
MLPYVHRYVAREVPPNVACAPHTHGSWKPLTYNIFLLFSQISHSLRQSRAFSLLLWISQHYSLFCNFICNFLSPSLSLLSLPLSLSLSFPLRICLIKAPSYFPYSSMFIVVIIYKQGVFEMCPNSTFNVPVPNGSLKLSNVERGWYPDG